MTPLKVAVIGLGHLGRHHARILNSIPAAQLTAVCDLEPAKFNQPECPQDVFRTVRADEAIERAEAVVVAVPTESHEAVAVPALLAGLDVLVEKPLAASLDEAARMLAAAESGGGALMVGHVERFNGAYRAARGQLPDVRFVEGHRLSVFGPRGLDVDVVLDLMIHDLDLVLLTVGRPAIEVQAMGVPVLSSRVDIASARITFEGGCVANLTASRVSSHPTRKIRFFDRDAYWSLDLMNKEADVTRLLRMEGGMPKASQEALRPEGEPLRLELEDFVAAAAARRAGLEARPMGASGAEGFAAVQLGLRVREAIAEHFRRHGGAR